MPSVISAEPRNERNEPQQHAQRHGHDLTTGSIPRLLINFAIPLLIGNFIQAAYSIVNRIWVGHYLGPASIAAITNSLQVAFILIALANGLTMGSSILVSQFAGARNWDGVRRVVQNSILLVGALGIILFLLGEAVTVPLLRAIHTSPESMPLAIGYMRLFLASFPFVFLAILTTFLLRGIGDSLTPLIFQGIGVVITAVLDPLFMLGWLGFPKLGLNGTAVAMLIAQSITVVAFFIYLHKKQHIVSPDWRRLRIDRPINALMLKISLPAALQQLLVSLGSSVMVLFINDYTQNATAGFGLASQIDMVAFFIAISFSMSIASLAGQNIGAQRHDRVREVFWWGMLLSGGCVLIISLVATLFPEALMRLFISIKEPGDLEAYRIGVGYLRIVAPSYLCFAIMFVGIGVINGAGHTFVTTLITLVGLWGIRVPLAAFLSHRLHRVEGIWYALVIGFAAATLMSMLYYASGHWKRAIIKHGPAQPAAEGG